MYDKTMVRGLWVVAVLAFAVTGHAQSPVPAITITNVGGWISGIAANVVTGWEFRANADIDVTALGVWSESANGLVYAHPVGIWNSSQQLLASTTIPAGTSANILNQCSYVSISPLMLVAGQDYIVADYMTPTTMDPVFGSNSNDTISTAPAIDYLGALWTAGVSGLTCPTGSPSLEPAGNLGPNLLFAAAPSSVWAAAVSGSWSNANNWGGTVPNAIGAGAAINVSTTAPVTITLDAPQTLGTLLLGNSGAVNAGYTLIGSGSNTLTLNSGGGGATISVTNGAHAINAPVVLNDNLTLSNSGSLSIGGVISNGSNGTMGMIISGAGLLVLAGGNTYSGNTTISGGTVSLSHPLAVQTSTVNVTNSGTLSFAAGNTAPTLGGLTGAGNIALATAAAEPVMLNVGNSGQSTIYSGILSGAGGLTKQGAGILTLTSPSTYSSSTVIAGGVIKLQSVAAGSIGIHFIGTGAAFSGAGGVVPMSNWNNESGYSFTGSALANSSGNNSGAAFSLSGANSYWGTGSTNQLLNGYVAVNNYNPMTLTITNIPYASYSIYAYVGDSNAGNHEKATINGTSYYYATEGGTLTTYMAITSTTSASYQAGNYIEVDGLSGSSQTVNIAGTTQQYGGLCGVEIVNTTPAVGNILPATTALSIAAGSTLDLGGGSQQVASLSDNPPGSGGGVINSSSAFPSVLTLSPTGGSSTFSGTLQGGGTLGTVSLMMSGSGRQVLSGSNSYTGGTIIQSGRFVVDGWLTNSSVSVSGGTLGGTGHLGSVTVNSGGSLAPGDSLGTLSVSGSLILGSGAVMDYELDTPSTSSMVSCGSLALNGQQFTNFTFTPTANFGPGIYNLIDASSVSGTGLGANTSGTIDGYGASLAVQGEDLVLTVVPEPSTFVLLGGGFVGLLGFAWRRRLRRRGLPAFTGRKE